jgi:hypothetical protein
MDAAQRVRTLIAGQRRLICSMCRPAPRYGPRTLLQDSGLVGYYCRLTIRYERRADIHEAFLLLACSLVCFNPLHRRY